MAKQGARKGRECNEPLEWQVKQETPSLGRQLQDALGKIQELECEIRDRDAVIESLLEANRRGEGKDESW